MELKKEKKIARKEKKKPTAAKSGEAVAANEQQG